MKSIECVIDNADMWMFKFEHLKKNLAGYTYKDMYKIAIDLVVAAQIEVEQIKKKFKIEKWEHNYEC